ncbi:hypothetical protein D7V78_00990 [Parabacteroides distasonis]|uniref:Uncharacterized protein n=1 Tax=Parabacteroides distasonis TaxID=823 RepID=A0A3L7ZYJ8_PARDI|nr:hypothetical protein [Parabacteroides distasonis]RLT75130.1 hypothetical protein D7V78_00990 [Parabacteroides distasonis]
MPDSRSGMFLLFAMLSVCIILFFLVSPAYGAGVPIVAGLKGRVQDMQGFRGKIPQALRARMIFPETRRA